MAHQTFKRSISAVACLAIWTAGTVATAAPAQAADPYPTAPVCTVNSDHVTIKRGSTGNSVREAQCFLNRTGAGLAVDGVFGSATDTAVRNFQRAKGLVVDGVVGPNTWHALIYGTSAPSNRDARVNAVISYAKAQLGKPYVYGAEGPNAFDCSGLTLRAYQQAGITLPRVSGDQARAYRQVSPSSALPGDLLHWPGHVGIYLGGGKVIDAGSTPRAVTIRSIWGSPTYHRVIE